MSRAPLAAILLTLSAGAAVAQTDEVVIRVVDTGPGLCTVTVMPDGHYMVFDAGHWDSSRCHDAVEELVPQGATVDLVVLSHSDSDHLASADEILATYSVGTLIWAPYFRVIERASAPTTWKNVRAAIRDALDDGTLGSEWSLARRRLQPGTELSFGDVKLTLLSGFNRPPLRWGLRNDRSKHRNAGSIVARLDYQGHSVLFTGDAVGRLDGADDDNCIATEEHLLDTFEANALRADVLIAPHHGADNASSVRFLHAVQPTFVVFSAGSDHRHPRGTAAARYLAAGVDLADIFRTDLGDGEGGDEWDEGAGAQGFRDPVGDDDVEIRLGADGVTVSYPTP